VVVVTLAAASASGAELPDTVVRVKPSIVGVGTMELTRRPPGRFIGTGFVVGDGLHVLTNAHVIPGALDRQRKEFLAVLTGGEGERTQTRTAEVVASDPAHDMALLKIAGRPLPALRLGDSRKVREGELYAFTGFPLGMILGMRPVTHRGIISAITPIAIPQMSSRQLDTEMIKRLRAPFNVFQLDATAYPGNSGSPLYDPTTGKVIGIVNMVFVKESKENLLASPSGISYAIPISYAKELLRRAHAME
jgi:serine protease Do